jgi:hypothetical protein
LGDTPQHRIHQASIVRCLAVGPHEPHREINRRMIGNIEPQNLGGADKKRRLDPRSIGRASASEKQTEEVAERAEAAQHDGHQGADERAVTLRKGRPNRIGACAIELIVERPMPPQDIVENVGRGAPRRQAGSFM